MRAASRALVGLLVGLGLLAPLGTVPPAAAQSTDTPMGPRCPGVVADQPLSVTAPFSGTVRRRAGADGRADADGRIESNSLLCAYGEGVAPAAEVTVAWEAGSAPCAKTEVAVAPDLDVAAFNALASSLAASAGQDCVAPAGEGWARWAVAGGALLGVALAAVRFLRRRQPVPVPAAVVPAPVPADEDPATVVATRLPDLTPVLAALAGRGGRDFARTGAGQLAAVAAVAYATGDSVSGDLARAGSLAALTVDLPPRPEVAALALARAHHEAGVGR